MYDTRRAKLDRKLLATKIFALLEEAASEGLRCPTNLQISSYLIASGYRIAPGSVPGILGVLVREKRIVVRIYPRNWRDIIICNGPNTGKMTLAPPNGNSPIIIIDESERASRDRQRGKWMKYGRFNRTPRSRS